MFDFTDYFPGDAQSTCNVLRLFLCFLLFFGCLNSDYVSVGFLLVIET